MVNCYLTKGHFITVGKILKLYIKHGIQECVQAYLWTSLGQGPLLFDN